MLLLQMAVQRRQMGAVHMAHLAALFTFQQKTVATRCVTCAELVFCAGIRHDFVNFACLFQPLQVAVHGGQPHRLALPVQRFRQLRRADAAVAGLDAG